MNSYDKKGGSAEERKEKRKLERMKSRGKAPENNEVHRKFEKGSGKAKRRKEDELRSSSRRAGIRISVKDGKEGVKEKAEARTHETDERFGGSAKQQVWI